MRWNFLEDKGVNLDSNNLEQNYDKSLASWTLTAKGSYKAQSGLSATFLLFMLFQRPLSRQDIFLQIR